MNITLFIGFLIATMVIVATPGPSVALASSQAMRFGSRAVILTVIGDAIGSIVHILIATIGLQLLLSVASVLLPWLQIFGGLYILYLGIENIKARHYDTSIDPAFSGDAKALLGGFLACVSNPKSIIFFAALFPAFIDPNYNIAVQSTIYGAVFIILDAFFIVGYATLTVYVFKTGLAKQANFSVISGGGLILIASFLIYKGIFELI